MLRVLRFNSGKNPQTGEACWEGIFKRDGWQYRFVPDSTSVKPASNAEVWLCQEVGVITEDHPKGIRLARVILLVRIFSNKETTLCFESNMPAYSQSPAISATFGIKNLSHRRTHTIVCVPDKDGVQPDMMANPFWVCSFRREFRIRYSGGIVMIIVNLIREDTAAKEAHEAEQREKQARRAVEQQQQADASRKHHEAMVARMDAAAAARTQHAQDEVDLLEHARFAMKGVSPKRPIRNLDASMHRR